MCGCCWCLLFGTILAFEGNHLPKGVGGGSGRGRGIVGIDGDNISYHLIEINETEIENESYC